jgi:hypothetical protein
MLQGPQRFIALFYLSLPQILTVYFLQVVYELVSKYGDY